MPELAEALPWPPGHPIVLATTSPARYTANLCRLVGHLQSRFGQGVVVTANRPYHVLAAALRDAGHSLDGLEFVDCISALTGHHPPNERGVTYIEGPLLLEMIALRTQQLARFMPEGQRFVVVDSVSTLKLYNGVPAVAEMTHTLSTRMRLMETPAAFLALDDPGEQGLREAIAGYCDHTLRL